MGLLVESRLSPVYCLIFLSERGSHFSLERKQAGNFEARKVCGDRTGPPLQPSPGTSALLTSSDSSGSANEPSQHPAKTMATPTESSVDSSWAGTHDGWRLRPGLSIPPRQELQRQTLYLTEHAQLFLWGLLTLDLNGLHQRRYHVSSYVIRAICAL